MRAVISSRLYSRAANIVTSDLLLSDSPRCFQARTARALCSPLPPQIFNSVTVAPIHPIQTYFWTALKYVSSVVISLKTAKLIAKNVGDKSKMSPSTCIE